MVALPRYQALFIATIAMGVSALLSGSAHAQPQKRADELNDEGKALLRAKKYAEATDRFRQAIVMLPDGRYYYNLCMSLYHEGKLGEALTACRAVAPNGGNDTAVKGANVIMDEHIKPKMREAGIDPDAAPTGGGTGDGGGGGGTGDGGGGGTGDGGGGGGTGDGGGGAGGGGGGTGDGGGAGGGTDGSGGTSGGGGTAAESFQVAPPPSLFTATKPPDHDYTWTFGGQLLGMNASIGETGAYSKSAGGFRLAGDYMLSPATRVGAQGYLGVSYVGEGDGLNADTLTIFDVGLAAYKEICRNRMCLKPLIGGHIALLQTGQMAAASDEVQLVTFGIRPEIGVEYALGSRMEHVITAGLGLNIYLPVVGDPTIDPADLGLDKSSANGYFGIGYTRRFNTPLGSSPFFTLQ